MKIFDSRYRAHFVRSRAQRLRRFFVRLRFGTALHPSLDAAYRRTRPVAKQAMEEAVKLSGYRERAANCDFSQGWSLDLAVYAHLAAGAARETVRNILEIGSFEGRSTVFLAGYFPNARIDCCDTFSGGSDFSASRDVSKIEERFDGNVAQFGDRIRKHKGLSRHSVPKLEQEGNRYDLVYVDANHFHDDALTDTLLSWPMLKEGGVMIWDDYTWYGYRRAVSNPRAAIDRFLDVHAGEYEAVAAGRMVAVRKNARNEALVFL